jgi:GT2 family glycosyltransferase
MNWTELSEDIHQYPIRPTYDGNQISIIIPTYKNVNFLIPCLNSLMYSCENLFEFEILLGIDNCQETLDFVSQNSFFTNALTALPPNVRFLHLARYVKSC